MSSGLPINNVVPYPSLVPPQPPVDNLTTPAVHNLKCHYVTFNYNIVIAIMCAMYLVFGIVYTLFGYRCFKAIMFLTGFIFASAVVYLICLEEDLLPTGGNAGVAVAAGILFGLITMLVQYVGLFMTGLHTGLLIGIIILASMHIFYTPHTIWVPVGILIGSGLLCAVVTLCWQKSLTIFGTSIYGGAIMLISVDYYVENFVLIYWFWDRIQLVAVSPALCWFSWLILGLWPIILITGLCVQWKVTGKGTYHQELAPPSSSKSQQVNLQKIRERSDRAELKQKKYRYLYQVRTAHGDVISQSYIKWLQDRALTAKDDTDNHHHATTPSQTAPLNPSETLVTTVSQMP